MSAARDRLVLSVFLLYAAAALAGGLHSPAMEPRALNERLAGDNPPLVIDVRSPDQYSYEHIPGAINIPAPLVTKHLQEIKQAGANAVLYCNDLRFTTVAEQLLTRQRVNGFMHLQGGLNAWRENGLPLESSFPK